MSWTRAIHLMQWADTQEARYTLPLLIRRLIRSTVPSLHVLNFPAGEQVQRPGFDGDVEATQGNEFVPAGSSGWEMGVDKSPKGKADDDFHKRTSEVPPEQQKRLAFVFVTPRVWQKKEEWVEDKRSKSHWRDVIALDANDLEHWLELAPAVDVWFTRLTGRFSAGVQAIQFYWQGVQGLAEHPLCPSVFTASREAEVVVVRKWLTESPSSLFMRTHGLNEGLDFLAALSNVEPDERLQNSLIVSTNEAWRHLTASREPLVLVADPSLALLSSEVASAVEAGHHVFVSGPRGIDGQRAGETLRRQDYLSLSEALQGCGYPPQRARSLAQASCGSSTILKRLIMRHPETRFPDWCRDEVRSSLAPFALIGGWVHVTPEAPRDTTEPRIGAPPPLDVWVVTELLGCSREDLDKLVTQWQRSCEPLFLRFGNSVLVASREDAWHLLGGSLSQEQLQRFREFALLVLDEDNPAFQLPREKWWLANLYGKVTSLSSELRRSIVETLALMATYPTAGDAGLDFCSTVQWVLERALPRQATWQRWASLGKNLTVIAEAAPELLLARVEDDLNSMDPELPNLFQDQSHSSFSRAIHSDLLWSLEELAWNPRYLCRVAVVLAKLAARDPEGKYTNRPRNSLKEIFLLWLWHTNASIEDRLQALSRVVATEPDVGWKLLTELLPGNVPTMSHNTCMPRWRPWAEGWSREKLQSQIAEYALAVADLVMTVAGSDSRRWAEAINGLLHINQETTEKVLAALEGIANAPSKTDDAVFPLWEELRELVAKHDRHASANWAFPSVLRHRLAAIRDRLTPGDPVLLHQWLFDDTPVDLPEVDPATDYQRYETALRTERVTALRHIVSSVGADGIFRLLTLCKSARAVGWLIGQEGLLEPGAFGLPDVLESTDSQRLNCFFSYVMCRFDRERWKFVNSIPTAGWTPKQVATFARCLPFADGTWQWLQRFGSEATKEYWEHVCPIGRQLDMGAVSAACHALIGAGRPFAAADVLHSAVHDQLPVPSAFIAEVLEATYGSFSSEGANEVNSVRYDLQQLVKALQRDNSFDSMRLARIEWGLLPLLDPDTSEVGPTTLIRLVETHPEFFVQLLSAAYRGENHPVEDSSVSEQDQDRAHRAHELLGRLEQLPGTKGHGEIDYAPLRDWIHEVRRLAIEVDRLRMCDYTLGELIVRAGRTALGDWPTPELAVIMEEIGTESLFHGFEIAVLNSRGVVGHGLWEGGGQERSLASRYRELSEKARPSSPQLAEAFQRIAWHYEVTARKEDEEAERRKLGR